MGRPFGRRMLAQGPCFSHPCTKSRRYSRRVAPTVEWPKFVVSPAPPCKAKAYAGAAVPRIPVTAERQRRERRVVVPPAPAVCAYDLARRSHYPSVASNKSIVHEVLRTKRNETRGHRTATRKKPRAFTDGPRSSAQEPPRTAKRISTLFSGKAPSEGSGRRGA